MIMIVHDDLDLLAALERPGLAGSFEGQRDLLIAAVRVARATDAQALATCAERAVRRVEERVGFLEIPDERRA